jgi:hypothetical protein
MNIKVQHVISDIEGVGGMQILRAIASGVTDPLQLLNLLDIYRFKASKEVLFTSLTGIYKEHCIVLLRLQLAEYDFFVSQMRLYEQYIEEILIKL